MMKRLVNAVMFPGLFAAAACAMLNPEFDESRLESKGDGETSLDSGSADQETGDAGDGDGDTGDGDGDGDTGDGDGDTGDGDGDTGDGDGDGDGDTGDGDGDPVDPECTEPSGGFMDFCTVNIPCEVGVCVLVSDGNVMQDLPGYCTFPCQLDQDCAWGAEDQCKPENLACVPTEGQFPFVCGLSCDIDEDCYPNQVCALAFHICRPLG